MRKHGIGSWAEIISDETYGLLKINGRSNVNLAGKYRTLKGKNLIPDDIK
jgi:hypothetical protein